MTPAEKILKMIEAVDREDSDALDEIDARFWCYLNGEVFEKLKRRYVGSALGDCIAIYFYHPDAGHGNGFTTIREYYTRSRDALKAIRPEGWSIDCGQDILQTKSIAYRLTKEITQVASPMLPTEELAELHAIVQAIQWERDNA